MQQSLTAVKKPERSQESIQHLSRAPIMQLLCRFQLHLKPFESKNCILLLVLTLKYLYDLHWIIDCFLQHLWPSRSQHDVTLMLRQNSMHNIIDCIFFLFVDVIELLWHYIFGKGNVCCLHVAFNNGMPKKLWKLTLE